MRVALFLFLVIIITIVGVWSIKHKQIDNSNKIGVDAKLDVKLSNLDSMPLDKLRILFLTLDVHSPKLSLDKAITAIKRVRKKYPLDDKLKMVDMELENRRANKSDHSTKNTTPHN